MKFNTRARTQVEQDVQDLGSAIDIAARDPARYRCDAEELARRRQFVQSAQECAPDLRTAGTDGTEHHRASKCRGKAKL